MHPTSAVAATANIIYHEYMEEVFMCSRIALIDNGIHLNYFSNLTSLYENIEIDRFCNIKVGKNARWLTHGTICGSIIKKYAPDSALVNVSLKSYKSIIDVEQLISAIELMIDMDIKLVNISVGIVSTGSLPQLNRCVAHFASKGGIIVAAGHNYGIRSYPSCFESVIGVSQINSTQVPECHYCPHTSNVTGIDFLATGIHVLERSDGTRYCTPNTSSFSAPYMTAVIYNLLRQYPGVNIYNMRRMMQNAANTKYIQVERTHEKEHFDY